MLVIGETENCHRLRLVPCMETRIMFLDVGPYCGFIRGPSRFCDERISLSNPNPNMGMEFKYISFKLARTSTTGDYFEKSESF
jgi:hypothetical protein